MLKISTPRGRLLFYATLKAMKISIIIPVYNEVQTIQKVIAEVKAVPVAGLEKEIVLVDDGSVDGTKELLQKLNEQSLRVIYHEKNLGKGAALLTGFKSATGDVAIIQDADLEYDPKEIEIVLKPFLENRAKVVYGSRYMGLHPELNFWHSLFNKIFTQFGNILMGQKITDIMTCYKAFDREVLDKLVPILQSKRFGFEPEVTAKVTKLGYKIFEVPISYRPRSGKEGKHMNLQGQIESLLALIKYSLFF